MKTELEQLIADDEGYREFPYRCTSGRLTIGYGYNLDAGMPEDEAHLLMRYRLGKLMAWMEKTFPWFNRLSEVRKQVLLSMAYQMGTGGLLGFRHMLAALAVGDFGKAAKEMLNSKWARHDSPARAKRLSEMMRRG